MFLSHGICTSVSSIHIKTESYVALSPQIPSWGRSTFDSCEEVAQSRTVKKKKKKKKGKAFSLFIPFPVAYLYPMKKEDEDSKQDAVNYTRGAEEAGMYLTENGRQQEDQ